MRAYAKVSHLHDRAREQRIADHVDMARRIALRLGRRLPPWLREEDLVASAMMGLAEAADRYDATRAEPFAAFAEKRIRGAILDELRRGDVLPRRVRTMARKVGATLVALEQRLARPPEDEEIAAALGVSVEKYRDELEMLTHVTLVEFEGQEEHGAQAEALDQLPSQIAERSEMLGRLREALSGLPERDAQVLSLYYVEEMGYAEVGEVLGVSESRVCQLHARALSRLRADLGSYEDPGDDDDGDDGEEA